MSSTTHNGFAAQPGSVAKVQVACGEWKTGAVIQNGNTLVTVRCYITDENPDGILFSATPEKTIVLIP